MTTKARLASCAVAALNAEKREMTPDPDAERGSSSIQVSGFLRPPVRTRWRARGQIEALGAEARLILELQGAETVTPSAPPITRRGLPRF